MDAIPADAQAVAGGVLLSSRSTNQPKDSLVSFSGEVACRTSLTRVRPGPHEASLIVVGSLGKANLAASPTQVEFSETQHNWKASESCFEIEDVGVGVATTPRHGVLAGTQGNS